MVIEKQEKTIPRTLAEFMVWEPNDGFKYEWNDGELIKFTGMNKNQVYIFGKLNRLFIAKGYWKQGLLIAEQEVLLSGIQVRRPDVSYYTLEQELNMAKEIDEIPEFVVEIISGSDNSYKVEEKIGEYYKSGVKIVWLIYPESKTVHVYSSRREVKICIENDICSADPVLPDFQIGVDELFG